MPTNNIKIFAGSGGANVISQTAYENDTSVINNGYTVGIADPAKINKVLRQSSIMSNAVATLITQVTGDDVIDNGTSTTIIASLNKTIVSAGSVTATGTSDSITANISPALTSLENGTRITIKATHTNTTTTPTLSVNGLTPVVIVKDNNQLLKVGDIVADKWYNLVYDTVLSKWVLTNSSLDTESIITVIADADTYQPKVDTDNERWELLPKGIPTMLFPSLTDEGNLTTWLTNHPKWKQCNGSYSTPDLRGKFIIGSDTGLETTSITGVATTTGGSKDAVVVAHSHNNPFGWVNTGGNISTGAGPYSGTNVSTDSAGESGTNKNLPPYYSMVYVIRVTD